jgi:U3 small nucleolar RNA-associated protein 22
MHRKVDRGPPATDEVACQRFKLFWGSKSEMRRFKDGSIIEAVVWTETVNSLRSESLIANILEYILQRHLPFHSHVLGLGLRIVSGQIVELLPHLQQQLPSISETNYRPECFISHSTQSLFRRSVEATDLLRRVVTSDLKEFPLVIESFRPIHSFLRYTSLFPPKFNLLAAQTQNALRWFSGEKINTIISVIPVVIQLQKSSRWPSDLTIVRSLKSALLVRLSDCLEQQFSVGHNLSILF